MLRGVSEQVSKAFFTLKLSYVLTVRVGRSAG